MRIALNRVEARRSGLIEAGMWVMTDQGLGIIAVERDRSTWVHLVDDQGDTLAALPLDRASRIRIAKAKELPAKRVGHLSDKQLAAFGYV